MTLKKGIDCMKGLIIAMLRFYQVALSPYLGGRCRFVPSCSAYAIDAVQSDGARRGLAAAFFRLLRCHPFGGGGFDPHLPRHK